MVGISYVDLTTVRPLVEERGSRGTAKRLFLWSLSNPDQGRHTFLARVPAVSQHA
jgi:hypothetical protein